ncbi:MAG: hypothetical protein ABWY25_09515 [Paenisporosarcina sp.]
MPRTFGTSNAALYSSAPAVGPSGDMYYDSTTKALYVSDGTAWDICVGPGNITGTQLAPLAVTTTNINSNAVIMNKLVAAASSPMTIARIAAGAGNYSAVAGAPVVVCTSSTRPTGVQGLCIYETDTNKFLIYTTATTGWQLPWNQPWGQTAYATVTTNQGSISSTLLDVTNLTAQWVGAPANRLVKTTIHIPIVTMTAAGTFTCNMSDVSNVVKQQVNLILAASAGGEFVLIRQETTPGGNFARKARVQCTAGTGNLNMTTLSPAFIMMEDIGPASAPA